MEAFRWRLLQWRLNEVSRTKDGRCIGHRPVVMRRHISILFGAVIGIACSLPAVADVQRLWPGPQSVLLIKVVEPEFYYCTWTMDLDPANFATLDERNAVAFDLAPQRPLTFRIRWRNEAAEGIPNNGVLYAIVDGTAFLFRISMVKRGQAQTDVVAVFDEGYQRQSTDDLWSKLAKARSFRAYLANGEFKDARTAGFSESVARLRQCSDEAATLNKAAAP